jgi:hypothetical protein
MSVRDESTAYKPRNGRWPDRKGRAGTVGDALAFVHQGAKDRREARLRKLGKLGAASEVRRVEVSPGEARRLVELSNKARR